MQPHEIADELKVRCERLVGKSAEWSGVIYRMTSPDYARSKDLLSGAGVKQWGARYTPPGSFPTVYGSLTPETALQESLAWFRDYGIPDHRAMPRVMVAIEVNLQHVLDVTNARVRQRLGVTLEQLCDRTWRESNERDEEALTQAIGRAAWKLGLEGLLCPSARLRRGANLAVFPENLIRGSMMSVKNVSKPKRPRTKP